MTQTTESAAAEGGAGSGTRHIYFFGEGHAEGNAAMKDLLGGKGAGLAEMTNAGVPVPPGFTITTAVCRRYYAHGGKLPPAFAAAAARGTRRGSSARWASASATPRDPLLVSVRSGAKFSMPGMMDTILNLGLNDRSVAGPRDAHRRTRASPGTATGASSRCSASVVLGLEKNEFEELLDGAQATGAA